MTSHSKYRNNIVLWVIMVIFILSAKGYVEILDTNYSILTADAIINKGSLQLDIPFAEMYTHRGTNGNIYSKYGIGLPFYFLPWIGVGHLLSSLSGISESEISGFLISFSNIPIALLCLILFRKLGHHFKVFPVGINLLVIALGLGTMAWRYSVYDFSEEIQMLLLLLTFYGTIKGTTKSLFYAGIGFSGLLLVKLVYIAYLPVFIVYILAKYGNVLMKVYPIIARFLIPITISIVIIATLNFIRFGNPLESGYGHESVRFHFDNLLWTIPALLGSANKGLFIYCPILLLALLGWRSFFKQHFKEAALSLSLILINLCLSGAWWAWSGGWCYGPRLLVPFIPFYLLPLCFWLGQNFNSFKFKIAVISVIFSILVQVPGILVKDQQVHHFKEIILAPNETKEMPSDYTTTYVLLWHKFKFSNENYNISEFGLHGNKAFNFDEYSTYQGFNIWSEQLARHLNINFIRFIPLLGGICIIFLMLFGKKFRT